MNQDRFPRNHIIGFRTVFSCLLWLISVSVAAQIKIRPQHFYTVAASAGYSQFLTNQNEVNIEGRPTAALTLAYELRHKRLWLQTGLETRYMSSFSRYNRSYEFSLYPVEDTQGKLMTMHYTIHSYSETEKIVSLQVPLLVGFISEKGFYLGGGLQLGWCVFSAVDANVSYSTAGIYSQYDQSMGEMPNHSFGTFDEKVRNVAKAGFIGSFVFELGADVYRSSLYGTGRTGSHALQLGAYASLGLNNPYKITKQQESLFIYPDPTNAQRLNTESLLSLYADKSLCLPIQAGVKLTYLFQITTDRINCPSCR